ncbi:MAG: hypothetical protein KY444_08830 [Gemmatimonadetes bacterium]|nr:hypothetical protein [Gemmatimonadota bacterium]
MEDRRQRPVPRTQLGCDKVPIRTYVTVEMWRDVTNRAEKAGISVSRYLSALIERDELDSAGRPAWAPLPATEPLPGLDETAAA